jgi:hypothetical protein
MKRKISVTLTALILIILPFLLGIPLGKYSPYLETNSFKTYIITWAAISFVLASAALFLLKSPSRKLSIPLLLLI